MQHRLRHGEPIMHRTEGGEVREEQKLNRQSRAFLFIEFIRQDQPDAQQQSVV